jgi:hypothetical protein
MNQIYGLGFDREYAPVKELSKRLSDHIKTGEPWEGEIIFKEYGRIAELSIPKDTKLRIRLKLKKIHYTDE